MILRYSIAIIAALALGCGTTHPFAVAPHQEALVAGFPSKPYPNQRLPGPDGRCGTRSGPPTEIVKGGGCWVAVVMDLSDCELRSKEGGYFVVHEGRCYYPYFNIPDQREPTSSL